MLFIECVQPKFMSLSLLPRSGCLDLSDTPGSGHRATRGACGRTGQDSPLLLPWGPERVKWGPQEVSSGVVQLARGCCGYRNFVYRVWRRTGHTHQEAALSVLRRSEEWPGLEGTHKDQQSPSPCTGQP